MPSKEGQSSRRPTPGSSQNRQWKARAARRLARPAITQRAENFRWFSIAGASMVVGVTLAGLWLAQRD